MPMTTESSSTPNRVYHTKHPGVSYDFQLPNGRSRSQYGYRTRQLTPEERENFARNSISGNVVSLIRDLEEETLASERAYHRDRWWFVHDRDYSETTFTPVGINGRTDFSYVGTGGNYFVSCPFEGAFGFTGFDAGFINPMPSALTLSNMAGSMMRASRPPSRSFALARFAGEQREAPLLWRLSNYAPKTKKEAGGAVLNYLFGIKPTGSDLGKLAELVLRSDEPINSLLASEKIREKKRTFRSLGSGGGQGEQFSGTTDGNATVSTSLGGKFTIARRATLPMGGLAAIQNIRFAYSYTYSQSLRTFATWEYYVPKPHNIDGRLASYRDKAQLLLASSKLDAATVYELSPWTWLGDWFVDFGGLLRYQRDIINNQIVATNCGYSTWEEYTAHAFYAEKRPNGNNGRYPYWTLVKDVLNPAAASIRFRHHKRLGGSPYSIGPSWSLSTQQWGILGSLGLARGIDLPNK